MGYVTYGSNLNSNQTAQDKNQVGFFSLKNDGDEAIVRIMHDTTQDFEIISTHQIQLNGKFRRINCVRNPKDSVDVCPLCANGVRTDYRFYIHLIQYTKAPDGSIVAEQKVWERPMSYADKISGYINNYGPMSDVICKIIRHGKAGDMKTEYDIIPNLNKQVYRDDLFVKIPNAFDGFKALGGIVLDKSVAEINEYINTGNFPMKDSGKNAQAVKETDVPAVEPAVSQTTANWSAPEMTTTQAQQSSQRPTFGNWSNSQTQQINRPTRF